MLYNNATVRGGIPVIIDAQIFPITRRTAVTDSGLLDGFVLVFPLSV